MRRGQGGRLQHAGPGRNHALSWDRGIFSDRVPGRAAPLFGDNEAIVLDGDRLVLSSSFWVDLGVVFFGPYLGTLTCGFQYDPAQQSFSLSPECTLQVYTPVDPSAVSLLQA